MGVIVGSVDLRALLAMLPDADEFAEYCLSGDSRDGSWKSEGELLLRPTWV